MKITPQSESFDRNNDNDQIEIAAVSASVESSAVLDAAPFVSTEDEGIRLLPAARNNDDTITGLLDRTGKQCSDFKHAIIMSPNHRDDNIDGGGGGEGDGASISSLDDENENENENDSFLLSPTLVRRQDRSSRLDSILRKLQSNPLLSTAALLMGTLTLIIWIYTSSSSSNNRFNVSKSSDGCNGKNIQHKTYPAFPAEELLGITYLHDETNQQSTSTGTLPNKSKHALNSVMLVHPPYKISDFQSNALTYWDEVVEAIEQTQRRFNDEDVDGNISYATPSKDLWTNFTTWGPCYPRPIVPRPLDNPDRDHHYLLRTHRKKRLVHNWTYIVQTFHSYNTSSYDKNVIYPMDRIISDECATRDSKKRKNGGRGKGKPPPPLGGLCRPSFLIIGQGKCGTSSLYHYLAGHPRILPAKEKQIDYFNYHKFLPLSWYYANFPTIESFLGTGALMTGEASPGYMPYPSVVEELVKRSSSDNNWILSDPGDDGGTIVGVGEWKARVRSLPKIIAIVRNPIERAKSSYKYNYVEPAIEKLRSGSGITVRGKRIPARRSDRYYRANHLFSFEELAYAELVELKECLKAGGKGERWAFDEYDQRTDSLFYKSVRRRSNFAFTSDSPPLINLDEACYDTTKSKAVPRAQWEHLALEHENKTLALPNLHLVQSILGRGVYALPLEWWYEIFSHVHVEKELRQIHVVCTEELADTPERTMENVTNFLGLPKFDFEDVTNVGRYNVGGHRGYDTITKLHPDDDDDDEHRGTVTPEDPMLLNYESLSVAIEELQQEEEKEEKDPLLTISDAFLNELIHFYHPYNERLFRLIGKQCRW